MTKEDKGGILEKHFPTPGNHPDCEAIYEAMDEFAKQQAIAFMKECIKKQLLHATTDETVCIDGQEHYDPDFDSVAALRYNQFIEQQNKPCE